MKRIYQNMRPRRLLLAAALLAGCAYPSSQSSSYQSYEFFQIDQKISQEEYKNYKYILEPYLDKINIDDLRVFRGRTLAVLRINHEDFCERDFCLTTIIRNCGKNACSNTNVVAPNRFRIEIQMLQRLGELLLFPTRIEDRYTAVLVNDRYVAATQGI